MLPPSPASFVSRGQLPGLAEPGNGPSPDRSPRDSTGDPARRKPTRLSLACNLCRKRKVRCDARLPKCSNCTVRNEACETTDLRKPANGLTIRARALPGSRGRPSRRETEPEPAVHDLEGWTGPVPEHLPEQAQQTPGRCGASASGSAASPALQQGRTGEKEAVSFVSRGYRESTAAQNSQASLQEHASDATPEAVVNTDDTPYRFKFVGGTSVQCLFAFIDLHVGTRGLPPASPLFRHGMRHCEEFLVPLEHEVPDLPSRQILYSYVDSFVTNIWPLFPAVDRSDLEADVDRLVGIQDAEPVGLKAKIAPRDLPSLAMMDGQAWHVIGQAIRLAQSLGLHKKRLHVQQPDKGNAAGTPGGYQANYDLHRRLWWSCFSLEKLLQLECGRPSSTCSGAFDRMPPAYTTSSPDDPPDYFTAWVSLAGIMGRISDRLYSRKFSGSEELFAETCRLDQAALEWDRCLPESLRPEGEELEHLEEGSHSVLASFLSQQYFSAQITILRLSLLFPPQSFTAEVKKRWATLPPSSASRLLRGAALCASAARAIAVQTLQLADRHHTRAAAAAAPLLGPGQPFLAAVVLALGVLREPRARLARADAELLGSVTEYLGDVYARWGQDEGFVRLFGELRERVGAVLREGRGAGSGAGARAGLGAAAAHGGGLDQRMGDAGGGSVVGLVPSYDGAGQMGQHGGAMQAEVAMGLDAVVDFDMEIFGGRELWNLMEVDWSGWGGGN
ncbi:putative transcriptional regulatory protein [Parachaetomium inaequale]|uniref:Transcriptional regulatory protein n=1 Tax=Parachaetomium inaequale TaxID=2588326 RepID=A0AAN6SVG4_9PEZI|nr:putative transcriptional regulatory protein [Parachaetomium inaequale]